MEFDWDDLIEHLTSWKRLDFRSDPERDEFRLRKIEFVLEQMLVNLRAAGISQARTSR